MNYKTYIISTIALIAVFILSLSLVHLPVISEMIVHSEKNTYIKLIKLFSLLFLLYYCIALAKISKKIAVLLTLLSAIFFEIILLKNYQIPVTQSITREDRELGWIWIPNSHKINTFTDKNVTLRFNSKGLRGSEESLNNKILFLGNSIVQAQHIDEENTFVYLTNGINGGFDGYDTYMQRDRFKRDLYLLDANKLILIVNTVDIHSLEQSKQIVTQTLNSNQSIQKMNPIDHLLKIKIVDLFSLPPQKQEDIEQKDTWYLNKHKNTIPKPILDEWENTILDIKNSFNGQLYIVLTPPRAIFSEYKKNKQEYTLNKRLNEFSQLNGIIFIDLLPYLAESNENIYVDYVHFNEKGHSIVAKTIKEYLKDSK